MINNAVPCGRGWEHAAADDVVEQVALPPTDGIEGQTIVPGLFLGQFPCAGPFDAAQVGVGYTTR
jgi:hypothetical protein